jgi:hypothetical protein
MVKRNALLSDYLIFFLAIESASLWLYEIHEIIGWQGLNWLNEDLYSPFVVFFLASMVYLLPFIKKRPYLLGKIFVSLIILYPVNLLSYELGKSLCYNFFGRLIFPGSRMEEFLFLGQITMLYVFVAFAYWFTTHLFFKENSKWNILLIAVLLPLAIPLSMLTIYFFPGFGTNTGFIDAVKMGYPIFWTIMMLGVSGILIERQADLS